MKAHLMIRNSEEVSQLYKPTKRHTSKQANICLSCEELECTGDCARVRELSKALQKKKVRKCKKSK